MDVINSELAECQQIIGEHFGTNSKLILESSYWYRQSRGGSCSSHHRRNNEKTFLNSNYKYKRREGVFSNDPLPLIDRKNNENSGSSCTSGLFSFGKRKLMSIVQIFTSILSRYVRYMKMLDFTRLNVLMIVMILMVGFTEVADAGVCWIMRQPNGKCTQRYSSNISEEECCKEPNFAYTEKEMSDVELFFAEAIDDGAMCRSCLDSCETAKCGAGKRCVYRKGRPKCVCAPVCRSSKKNKPKNGPPIFPASPAIESSQSALQRRENSVPISFFDFGAPMTGLDRENADSSRSSSSSSTTNSRNSPSSINSKTSTSSKKTIENQFESRWRRDTNPPTVRQTLKTHETERPVSNKRRKNQRKSNQSKRRKHNNSTTSTTTTTAENLFSADVEKISNSPSRDRQIRKKSEKLIIMAETSTTTTTTTTSAVSHWKASNSSRKDNSHRRHPEEQQSQQHHNRHQYKRQQHLQSSNNSHSNESNRRKSELQNSVLLDEKIRSGFFSHGFPYPSIDETLNIHGRYYNPVCGTDGKTYKTECQLKKRACRRESTILAVAYRGHCQTSCKLVRCLNNLTCVEDQYGIPHCISCTISCPEDDISSTIDPAKAVCGADGLTYKSVCDINRLICTTGRSIAVAYYGFCQGEAHCNTIQCRDKQVCLSDWLTNKPRCISCSFKCPRKRRPQGQRYQEHKICGTDNSTYHSWCHMRRESCNRGFYIDVKHIGPCHKNSVSLKPTFT